MLIILSFPMHYIAIRNYGMCLCLRDKQQAFNYWIKGDECILLMLNYWENTG